MSARIYILKFEKVTDHIPIIRELVNTEVKIRHVPDDDLKDMMELYIGEEKVETFDSENFMLTWVTHRVDGFEYPALEIVPNE